MSRRYFKADGGGRLAWWAVTAGWLVCWGPWPAGASQEPLVLRLDVDSRERLVGESFPLRIAVVAGSQPPLIVLPRLERGRMAIVGREARPVQASAIGTQTAATQLHITLLRVVGEVAGTLEIPPIEVRDGNRLGKTRAVRIQVQQPPAAGRPAWFLGGVGAFTLETQVEPQVARVGDQVVYRLIVTGPGALGMNTFPDTSRFEKLAVPLEIKRGRQRSVLEPPSRIFEWSIRPLESGEVVLPPLLVAAYHPRVKQYQTQASPTTAFRAVAVPRLDPALVAPIGEAETAGAARPWVAGVVGLVLAALAAGAGLVVWSRRKPQAGAEAARRFAARVARSHGPSFAPAYHRFGNASPTPFLLGPRRPTTMTIREQTARRFMDQLAHYLHIGLGRPPGALTVEEARAGVAALAANPALAERVAQFTELCDQVLYQGADNEQNTLPLALQAYQLFRELGGLSTDRGSAHGGGAGAAIPPSSPTPIVPPDRDNE